MPKTRKNVDENFKVAAVQRLQSGGVPANDLAKELGVSIWSLRKWSRQYRKKAAAGAGAAREPAAAPKELPTKAKQRTASRAASLRGRINRHDRTDRIGDIGVGQAAGGAQNGGRDLEAAFGRHAGVKC